MVIKLSDVKIEENYFQKDKKSYKVKDILKIADTLEEFDLPICGVDISIIPWDVKNILQFCEHMKRVNDVNMEYPIILDNYGFICDGWHRLVKAIINGQETIKAKRLIIMPEPYTNE